MSRWRRSLRNISEIFSRGDEVERKKTDRILGRYKPQGAFKSSNLRIFFENLTRWKDRCQYIYRIGNFKIVKTIEELTFVKRKK